MAVVSKGKAFGRLVTLAADWKDRLCVAWGFCKKKILKNDHIVQSGKTSHREVFLLKEEGKAEGFLQKNACCCGGNDGKDFSLRFSDCSFAYHEQLPPE